MKKKKKTKNSSSPSPESDLQSPEFHTAVARTAVAQICQSVGYKGAQTSALQTLTDVAVRYLRSLASSAATSAASTGRTQCNLLDVLRAFEDLHRYTGFHGNSNPNRRLSLLTDSSLLRDTMKFVYWNREIPFSKPLPRRCRTTPPVPASFSGEIDKPNHVPIWLPDFPKIDDSGEKGQKTVIPEAIEGEIGSDKKTNSISNLPEKRQKVCFRIGGGGGRIRNEIESNKIELDLRNGVWKKGKRISFQFQIYDDDDENLLNASSGGNHDDMKKMKLEESCSRTKMIMMH